MAGEDTGMRRNDRQPRRHTIGQKGILALRIGLGVLAGVMLALAALTIFRSVRIARLNDSLAKLHAEGAVSADGEKAGFSRFP